jgi:hypothetical protein
MKKYSEISRNTPNKNNNLILRLTSGKKLITRKTVNMFLNILAKNILVLKNVSTKMLSKYAFLGKVLQKAFAVKYTLGEKYCCWCSDV